MTTDTYIGQYGKLSLYQRPDGTTYASHPPSTSPRTQKKAKPVVNSQLNTPGFRLKLKEGNPEYEDIAKAYAAAKNILRLCDYRPAPANAIKWSHWSTHHAERQRDTNAIRLGHWMTNYEGTLPSRLDENTRVRRNIIIIQYGGRAQDSTNFAHSCKGIIDQLVVDRWIYDDSREWLKALYLQQPGGPQCLDILFMEDTQVQPKVTHDPLHNTSDPVT